ncbi:MAG: hypothetical protein F6J87_29905 [Spirulina sp. SIO3F2]|nr:hypothetical protein [Spirulina sp. SIO3F2]
MPSSKPTNGHRPSPSPQDIVDAEFLENGSIPPPPPPMGRSASLGVADSDSVAQQLNQFEQHLSHQFQMWQYQQTQAQQQERRQLLEQFWATQEHHQQHYRRLHEHIKRLEHKLHYGLQERQTESSRRSIFVMLGVFVLAIAYITVLYPVLHRPAVQQPMVPQQTPIVPPVQPQTLKS